MAETNRHVLRVWIREALLSMGGQGKRESVLAQLEKQHGHDLTPEDCQWRDSVNMEVWKNNAAWESNHMKEDGLLRRLPGGRWQLTELGRAPLAAIDLDSLLED